MSKLHYNKSMPFRLWSESSALVRNRGAGVDRMQQERSGTNNQGQLFSFSDA